MELSDLLHPYVEELCSDTEDGIDSLFSAVYDYYLQNPDTGADQDVEVSVASAGTSATELAPTTEACGGDTPPKSRFSAPVTEAEVQTRREQAIPQKTQSDTQYCTNVWKEWSKHRNNTCTTTIPSLNVITPAELQKWMTFFVLEVRKQNSMEYPPATLLHICSGIQRYLRSAHLPNLDIFSDSAFSNFRRTLDAEMKRLTAKGLGSKKKKAEPLTEEQEETLWRKGILGDHTPQALLNTMVFCSGVYFALRSGKEHRQLRFSPSQIEVVRREGSRPYLLYTEDHSKNHPGGLRGHKITPKSVKHYANVNNPARCFVRLFSLFTSLCPAEPKRNSFYLKPLKKPTTHCWYSREPLGHNKLSQVVSEMCKEAGIVGYYTNHSLRATSATRLFNAGADEQLIMERTGHRSIDGVRSYKRTSENQQQEISDILSLSASLPMLSTPSQPTVSPSPSLPLQNNPATVQRDVYPPVQCANAQYNMSNMPGIFTFHSCGSVVVNINK